MREANLKIIREIVERSCIFLSERILENYYKIFSLFLSFTLYIRNHSDTLYIRVKYFWRVNFRGRNKHKSCTKTSINYRDSEKTEIA